MDRPYRQPLPVLRRSLTGILLAPLLLASSQDLWADVVLLRTGAVVEGEVVSQHDRVRIVQPVGEMVLHEREVLCTAPSLTGVYHWLKDQQSSGAQLADEHLELAQWCMRQRMWAEASLELLEARTLEPASERVARAERQLMQLSSSEVASAQAEPYRQTEGEAVDKPNEPVVHADPGLRLPHDGLEHFTRRIQPLLVNNCTNGGCHGAREGDSFPLDRRLLYDYADARSTESNLRLVMSVLDTEEPEESALLAAARGPHHGATPFSGNHRAEWLDRLEGWSLRVAMANGWTAPEATPAETDPMAPGVMGQGVELASHEEPVVVEPLINEALPPQRIVRGGALASVAPRDEFDPEVFNRRFRRPEDDLPE